MLSNRMTALLDESESRFTKIAAASSRPQIPPQERFSRSWAEIYGLDKLSFVDAATAASGGMPPPGMDPAMMGGAPPGGMPTDPAMMGGAPPMDPAMMGGAMPPGGALPPDPAAGGMPPMDPAAMAAAGLPPPGGGAVDPATGQPLPPKVKVDTNAVLLQLLRLVALMADHLKIPVPASLMTIMPQELMSLPQNQPTGSSAPAGDAGGGGAGPIPPIEPVEPMAPAAPEMPKQGGFDGLLGLCEATKLKQGW